MVLIFNPIVFSSKPVEEAAEKFPIMSETKAPSLDASDQNGLLLQTEGGFIPITPFPMPLMTPE